MDIAIHNPGIVVDLDAVSRDHLLQEMIKPISGLIAGIPPGRLLQAILNREKQCPTVVSRNLAMPHARVRGLDAFYVVCARSKRGVEFAPGKSVRLICLILGPDGHQKQYLDLLAMLLRFFQQREQKMLKTKIDDARHLLLNATVEKS